MPREQEQVTGLLLRALKAINEGRVPADEKLIGKLRRRGLIARSVFDRTLILTDAGRAVLADATNS